MSGHYAEDDVVVLVEAIRRIEFILEEINQRLSEVVAAILAGKPAVIRIPDRQA